MGIWHSSDTDNLQSTNSNIETVSDAFVNLGDSIMQVCKYQYLVLLVFDNNFQFVLLFRELLHRKSWSKDLVAQGEK